MERFLHIREQGSEENFFSLIGGEVAVASGQTGGDDEQQIDAHKNKRSSKTISYTKQHAYYVVLGM